MIIIENMYCVTTHAEITYMISVVAHTWIICDIVFLKKTKRSTGTGRHLSTIALRLGCQGGSCLHYKLLRFKH